jgi:hypothetical protein
MVTSDERLQVRSATGTLAIRLPQHILAAIERRAAREGNRLSATARRLLSLGLEADAAREPEQ